MLMLRAKEHAIDEALFIAGAESVFEAMAVGRHLVVDVAGVEPAMAEADAKRFRQ